MRRPTVGVRGTVCLTIAACASACSSIVLPDDPADDQASIALSLWTEVDAYYPWFELKGVDWDAVRDTMLTRVGPDTSTPELFDVLADMLEVLEDGHVALTAPFASRSWTGWFEDHPENFDPVAVDAYLGAPRGFAVGGSVSWGLLASGVGYLRIGSFGVDGVEDGVDAALQALAGIDGLVLDVRGNGGGSDRHSEAVASRFSDHRFQYRTVRYKSGPGHEDFGPEIRAYIEPGDGTPYLGPVVLLQNRRVFSAAEDFVLAMRELAQVTSVGDTTGGGSGNPIGRELPNGWVANVPRWREWTVDGDVFEGIGLAPDETVAAPDSELATGRDAILERAVVILGASGPEIAAVAGRR